MSTRLFVSNLSRLFVSNSLAKCPDLLQVRDNEINGTFRFAQRINDSVCSQYSIGKHNDDCPLVTWKRTANPPEKWRHVDRHFLRTSLDLYWQSLTRPKNDFSWTLQTPLPNTMLTDMDVEKCTLTGKCSGNRKLSRIPIHGPSEEPDSRSGLIRGRLVQRNNGLRCYCAGGCLRTIVAKRYATRGW